jgi:aspartate aminotransferase-like enzyme
MPERKKLMIPGPVDVWDDTLDAMGKPITPHYGDEWIALYWELIGLVKQVFQTQNDIYLLVSSGSGAMDACLGSMFYTGEKVAVVCNGPFANRTIEILNGYGIQVVRVESAWGKAADVDKMRDALRAQPDIAGVAVVANETGTGVKNPVQELAQVAHERDLPIFVDAVSAMGGYSIPVDEWELDAIATSSNKCLESFPGVGLLSVSERAWKLIDAKKHDRHHGWYTNLSAWKDDYVNHPAWGDWHPYPITLCTNVMLALRASLKRIIEEETLAGHFARFAWAQSVVRAGMRQIGCDLVAVEEDASPTVTSIWKRDDMEVSEMIKYMGAEHGFMMAGATGELTGKVFRISHMGRASTKDYLFPCLLGIEDFLRSKKGIDIPVGASLVGLKDYTPWY